MTKITQTEEAELDLLSIWVYIAEDNRNATNKLLVKRTLRKCIGS